MKAAFDDGWAQMHVGDSLDVLSKLPEKSVHTCVTSPPYFGLRSYLPADHPDKMREGGTQETPEAYVEWLVEAFRGVKRVLRDDGTVWLNIGDSYAVNGGARVYGTTDNGVGRSEAPGGIRRAPVGAKPKDLLMIPARVALALQGDGWYLRSQIVWTKPNPMPESVTDRPTQATEMVYLFSKKPRYFYDSEAVKEKGSETSHGGNGANNHKYKWKPTIGSEEQTSLGRSVSQNGAVGRNLRNYWQISTTPYKNSHYAVFPPELPLRCIKAGTSEKGVCSECLSPYRRVMERTGETTADWARKNGHADHANAYAGPQKQNLDFKGSHWKLPPRESRTVGWEPTCSHDAPTEPATALDPFSGSGTTGLVARKLGRKSILIDLDDRNVKLLEERMGWQGVLL